MGNIEEAVKYLKKLREEMEYWQSKVDSLPGDSVSVNNPYYKMLTTASGKYAAASYMFKLMTD